MAPTGERHRLEGRGPLERIVVCLVDAHARTPGARVTADALLEAGWPSERPTRESGLNRVYAAISTLRATGLRTLLQRDDGGYRLDPRAQIAREER